MSSQTITSGDGYVEFVASELTRSRMLGLSSGDTNQGYADIDFALYINGSGQVLVYEAGSNKGTFGSYARETGCGLR